MYSCGTADGQSRSPGDSAFASGFTGDGRRRQSGGQGGCSRHLGLLSRLYCVLSRLLTGDLDVEGLTDSQNRGGGRLQDKPTRPYRSKTNLWVAHILARLRAASG